MGHSVLRKLLGAQEQGNHSLGEAPSKNGEQSDSVDLLAVLRQNLENGSQPPAAVLHATAEAARILSGADGLALALRTKGVIVCRARSGDPTPELGAPLSVDAGISGECVRSASILVCHDTSNDPRVDPEVCRFMGIQSIVVVPLRGPSGIAGILEAFSTRAGAFGEEQVNSLRRLAEIAEAAYQRECGTSKAVFDSTKAMRTRPIAIPDRPVEAVVQSQPPARHSHARRYWIAGLAVTAVLLVAGVWLSGREPSPEATAAAKEPSVAPRIVASGTTQPTSLPEITLPKPKAGITRAERNAESAGGTSAAGAVKKAAQIEPEASQPEGETAVITPAKQPTEARKTGSASAPAEPTPDPPSVTIAASEARPLAGFSTSATALPTLATKISQGVVRGALIRKIEPIYPAQAMKAHISGTVTLEVTVAENGAVRDVQKVSGSPLLMQAAIDAVRQWRYSPSLLDNKPVEVHVQVTVLFRLPGEGVD